MAKRKRITVAELRALLRYDPETGEFTWLQTGSGRNADGRAGSLGHKGCIQITIRYRNYKAHMLAWLYMTGKWPQREIDHWNTKRADNRWSNLRLATRTQNRRNSGLPRNNKSGYVGVFWDKYARKWRASIGSKFLGNFATPEEGAEAYRKAALAKYGEFAHESLKKT